VSFGSLHDIGAVVSFVGYFSRRFSIGEDESDITCVRCASMSSLHCLKNCHAHALKPLDLFLEELSLPTRLSP
jgi:hypothetical protein